MSSIYDRTMCGPDPREDDEEESEECSACEGSGEVDEETCEECEGTGQVHEFDAEDHLNDRLPGDY